MIKAIINLSINGNEGVVKQEHLIKKIIIIRNALEHYILELYVVSIYVC